VRRLLVVGEDYGNSLIQYHKDKYALTGKSGERLAELAGVTPLQFYAATDRTNVVELPEDWRDPKLVKAGVSRIMAGMHGRRVLLLGSKVAGAFGMIDVPYFTWERRLMDAMVARAPHPSGRNRVLNDYKAVADFRRFMQETMGVIEGL